MKLSELKIKNFRCHKDEVRFRVDNLTCIIGKKRNGYDDLDLWLNNIKIMCEQ